jgi:hypothetical protein
VRETPARLPLTPVNQTNTRRSINRRFTSQQEIAKNEKQQINQAADLAAMAAVQAAIL